MMTPALVAFARVTAAAGAGIVVDNALGCTVTKTADGDYDVNIGNAQGVPGLDKNECIVQITPDTPDRTYSCTHTSDAVKRLRFSDNLGALAAPGGFNVAFWRMPPV